MRDKIKSIFRMYDYKLLMETEDYIIYSVERNLYPGVEIVSFIDEDSEIIKKLVDDYRSLNFSVRICSPSDAEYIENYLFNWFFQVKENNRKIAFRYKEYTDAVIKAYGIPDNQLQNCQYKYVDCDYTITRNEKDTISSHGESIVSSIKKEIEQDGIKLIIVEAPAGYGKTSTAMELLNCYSTVEEDVRPFYMELARDRQAPTFYYLLLSQINKNFQVLLGDQIVMYNIKQGRIPLILDGFDELLSEDLDQGDTNKAKRKGETMLSTIADLLDTNAKIVLTTRKTAILTGLDFSRWYERTIDPARSVQVIRYKLETPKIENWLDKFKLNLLPAEIRNLSNPVLLGYLHFLGQNDFIKVSRSDSLVNDYVTRLLTREIERQNLPFDVNDQKIVFERLATAFAYENFSAESRDYVKKSIIFMSGELLLRKSTPARDDISLANAMTNHALLDRKCDNRIGFINDFVFGLFLGFAIINNKDLTWKDYLKDISTDFIEKAILSMAVADEDARESLWIQLSDYKQFTSQLRFMADVKLAKRISSSFDDTYLDGYSLESFKIGSHLSSFKKCCFTNMTFMNCDINLDYLFDCQFINCSFNQTNIIGKMDANFFFDCRNNGAIFEPQKEEEKDAEIESLDNTYADIQQRISILQKYLTKGEKSRKMQPISRLVSESENPREFKKLFSQLCTNEYILTNGDVSHISDAGCQYLNELRNGYN